MFAPLWPTLIDAVVFIAVVVPFLRLARHRHAIPALPQNIALIETPRVSVIVPARDERTTIGPAVESLLAQDYPELEVIAIDDRSSDGTGDVLRAIATRDARLSVHHVDALPAEWLGKNHALWLGAERATGSWLLFTDADVLFAPTTIARAIAYATTEGLDHLTLSPRLVGRGLFLRSFLAFFGYVFVALWGAYLANDPRSGRGVGIGAFNLVRREAYAAIGTMRALSLRPDDDIRLGRRLRAFGFRQRVVNGRDDLSVEWYPTLGAALRGLEKSMYSSMEYRIVDGVAVVAFIVATMVWPYLGAVLLGGIDRALLAAVVVCLVLGIAETYRQAIGPLGARAIGPIALLPFSALSFAYAAVRSMVLAERRGVSWRGTTYPLSLLRAQSGLEGTAAKRSR